VGGNASGVGSMSLRLAVVHEAKSDFDTATELADRVLCESITWLDESLLSSQRSWIDTNRSGSRLSWTNIAKSARQTGIRAHGHFRDGPGLADAASARRALEYLLQEFEGELHAVLLIRDQDDEPERRLGLNQARQDHAGESIVIVGIPVVEREAWVISGFVFQNSTEQERLDAERKRLGFNPCERSHELTACKDDNANRSPKRVVKQLTSGDLTRERDCWNITPLDQLRERGQDNGLNHFLSEVRDRLAPLIGHIRKESQ
jgi:hypothetical protein